MDNRRIGVNVDDFRVRPRDGLRRAAELAFRAVELPAAEGETSPAALSASGRRHLLRYVDGLGLRLTSLSADMPRLKLTDPRTVDERVERTCAVVSLAAHLGVPVVTAATGALTHPETGEPLPLARDALARIGELADAQGVILAIRPSGERVDRVSAVLDALRCPSLGIGLDPAALVMTGVNPMSFFARVPEQIRLFHARDAQAGLAERGGVETRLGEGDVDMVGVLSALEAIDYAGPLVLRRTDSQTPETDLQQARETLERLLARD